MNQPLRKIRIATRQSKLALVQSQWVARSLEMQYPDVSVELLRLTTRGDTTLETPLYEAGGKGLFTREIDRALLDGDADLAVHSLKDLPTEQMPGLVLAAVPVRESDSDVLILKEENESCVDAAAVLNTVPSGATVATGSLRRQAQLLRLRPDLRVVNLRGNVDTRLKKLQENDWAAILLAEAGLSRLGFSDVRRTALGADFLPAAGQGALGLVTREDDENTRGLVRELHDQASFLRVTAERAFLHSLGAGCHAPTGVRTVLDENGALLLRCGLFSPDGRQALIESAQTDGCAVEQDAHELGLVAAEKLLLMGAKKLLAQVEGGV